MKIMKSISAGVLVSSVACVIPAHAQPYCSERTLFGTYSSVFNGQILTGPLAGLVNGITVETFDGYGHFTSIDHVVLNGVQPAVEWRESSGTYTVNPDCTGKKVVTFLNNQPPPRITYFVITNRGQLNIVGGNDGAALSGVYTRLWMVITTTIDLD
jgi:hypothetical protein